MAGGTLHDYSQCAKACIAWLSLPEALCSHLQVNAAFDSHVDECDVVGFMHVLGYASFASQGERFDPHVQWSLHA